MIQGRMQRKNGASLLTGMILAAKRRRERALAMQKKGKSVKEVADWLGVSRQRAADLLKRAKQEAS